MINTASIDEIRKLLLPKPKIAIIMHKGPDGDAVGSSLGWMHVLNKNGFEVAVIAPDGYPDFLKWMPGNEEVMIFETNKSAVKTAIDNSDIICCLDFNAPSRMGDELAQMVSEASKPIMVVDHHQNPDSFADAYYVDDRASSTAEMIYRLAEVLGWDILIDHKAAMCLYTGLITDTGSFKYASVSPTVLRIAAKLLETGMDHTLIYGEVFDSNTLERLRLRGFALSERLVEIKDAGAAYISLSSEDLARFDFRKGDTEGLVNYALSIKGVNLAAFFAEKDGIIKISLRSRGHYDVNKLARAHFSGGGHINAAGGMSKDTMEETIKRFREIANEESRNILTAV